MAPPPLDLDGLTPEDIAKPPPGLGFRATMAAFWLITHRWLAAPGRGRVRLLFGVLIVLTLAQMAIQIRLNWWNRDFFDALEARDAEAFRTQILVFVVVASLSMAAAVYQVYVRQIVQLRWRTFLTNDLMHSWLRAVGGGDVSRAATADQPDQRIAEDVRNATELAVEFALGMFISGLTLIAFVGILWGLSGSLRVTLLGVDLVVPGYMVWAALGYAALGSALTAFVGNPLLRLNHSRTMAEAEFRSGLMQVRDGVAGAVPLGGAGPALQGLGARYGNVVTAVSGLMRGQRNLMWLTTAYASIALIFPTMVAAPAYFGGAMTLGALMQIGAAFAQVQGALNWFVENYARIAEWRIAVSRIIVLQSSMEAAAPAISLPDEPSALRGEIAR